MSDRARFYVYAHADVNIPVETIDVTEVVPFNMQLVQQVYRFNADPVDPAVITCDRIVVAHDGVQTSTAGFTYNIFSLDPSLVDAEAISCNEVWQFRAGDSVRLFYSNPSNREIDIELTFEEVI